LLIIIIKPLPMGTKSLKFKSAFGEIISGEIINDYYPSPSLIALPSSWDFHPENNRRLRHLLVSTRLHDLFLFTFLV